MSKKRLFFAFLILLAIAFIWSYRNLNTLPEEAKRVAIQRQRDSCERFGVKCKNISIQEAEKCTPGFEDADSPQEAELIDEEWIVRVEFEQQVITGDWRKDSNEMRLLKMSDDKWFVSGSLSRQLYCPEDRPE